MSKKKSKKSKCIICWVVIIGILLIGAMVVIKKQNFNPWGIIGIERICNQDECVNIQRVSIDDEITQEMYSARHLTKNRGFLLEFQQSDIYGLKMRDMMTEVDMVRLDGEYKVLYIKDRATPCLTDPCPAFSSPFAAKYILEMKGGIVDDMKLKIGNQLTLR